METLARPPKSLATRLSCADSAFPKLSHEAALAVIADLGIAAVDVCVFAGYRQNPLAEVVANHAAAADTAAGRIQHAGLAVADVFAILSDPYDELAVNHPDAGVREESLRQFQALIEFAGRLGAPAITLLPGMEFDGVSSDDSLKLAAAELQRRAELAGDIGLDLSIEAHYGSVAPTPARAVQLLDQAPDVTLTLDHSHFIFQGIPQDEIDMLIPRSRHVQLRQATQGNMQSPARDGAIDFGLVLERLDHANYAGFLGLEYQWDSWADMNRIDCISETAELRDLLLELAGNRP